MRESCAISIFCFLLVTSTSVAFASLSKKIRFADSCRKGNSITIAAVGDLVMHERLQKKAYAARSFRPLWRKVEPFLKAADITYGNLETPVADATNYWGRKVSPARLRYDDDAYIRRTSNHVYTSYPQFNTDPILLQSMKKSGFDVVSTANNHSLDRMQRGVRRTIHWLKRYRLRFTGTRPNRYSNALYWASVTRVKGIRIAWLACTYGTNFIKDKEDQVLFCFKNQRKVLNLVRRLRKNPMIDAVIVTPHWGKEYKINPSSRQKALARRLIEAGALAVIGSHPHVNQRWEKIRTRYGREGFVIYSLGNFISDQKEVPTRSTIVLFLGLTKSRGVTRINGVRYLPLRMKNYTEDEADLAVEPIEWIDRNAYSMDDYQSLEHLVKIYPASYRIRPGQKLRTNPHCFR